MRKINAALLLCLLASCNLSHVLKFEHQIESVTKAIEIAEESEAASTDSAKSP
jgi:hypothetical protein